MDVQPGRVLPEPAEAWIGGSPAEPRLSQPRHRPVVDHAAVLVAPRCVEDLADSHLADVASDHPVDEARRAGAGDGVLEQRRNVDQGGGVANDVVLVLVMPFVRARRVVARPFPVIEAFAQRERPLMDRGSNWHGANKDRLKLTGYLRLAHACITTSSS